MIRLLTFLFCLLAPSAFAQLTIRSASYNVVLTARPVAGGSVPDMPTGLTIASGVGEAYELVWDPLASNQDGFQIYRSIDGAGLTPYSNAGPNDALWDDPSGSQGDGKVTKYALKATNAVGASAFSASITNDIFIDAVAYYRMEEAAGNSRTATIDTAGFGALTEQGGTVSQVVGINNNAAGFTSVAGHSLKSTSASGNTLFASDFTISLWIYVTALPLTSADILIRESLSDINLTLDSGGTLSWIPVVGSDPATFALGSLNAWHFVMLQAKPGIQQTIMSVDAATIDNQFMGCSPPSGDDFLYINPPFGGLLTLSSRVDELCVWPRALSQAEAVSLATGRFK